MTNKLEIMSVLLFTVFTLITLFTLSCLSLYSLFFQKCFGKCFKCLLYSFLCFRPMDNQACLNLIRNIHERQRVKLVK